jgi:hypothetical protein
VLLQDANDLLFAETASLHRLSPQLENRLTSNRGLFRGAGHNAFWISPAFQQANWLLVFRLSGWRPDLFPKNSGGQRAEPQGMGRTLKWTRVEEGRSFDGFREFRDEFYDRLLHLKRPYVCSCKPDHRAGLVDPEALV